MRKLLRANFARLWKSKVFWLCAATMAAFGVAMILDNVKWIRYGEIIHTESCMFYFVPVISVLLAAFCSLFTGTEYANGTVRNKLIVGNTRAAIYGANLLTCIAAGVLICAAYILPAVAMGQLWLSGFGVPAQAILTYLWISLAMVVATASLFSCGAMLIHNRSASAVALLLIAFAMLFGSTIINDRLTAPPTYQSYTMVNEYGVPMEVEEAPNPNYLTGTKREVYQFFADFLPTGQSIQLSGWTVGEDGSWKLPLYSLGIALASSAAGLWLFKRKDIK